MAGYDQNRIASLEERLAEGPDSRGRTALSDLETLADLYLCADDYVPALDTVRRLLALPAARTLSPTRRAALEIKIVSCRLAQGDCRAALAHCRELLAGEARIDRDSVRCRIHLQCAEALLRLARLEDCRASAERGLNIADACGDVSLAAQALNILGRAAYRRGDLAEARDFYEQALALFRRVGDDATSAHVRNNLGLIHKNLCEWDAAAGHLNAALELHRASGHFAETANPLGNLGVVYQKSGDWKRAAECFTLARQVCAQVGDELRFAVLSIGLANVARLERRFDDSEGLLLGVLDKARSLEAWREEVLALEFLGELEFERGRHLQALERYREALPLAERVAPEGDLVLEIERRRAEALCAIGRLDEAQTACRRARHLARLTDDRLEFALACRAAGTIAWRRGNREEAIGSWHEAAELLTECRERFELGRTLLDMGRADPNAARARRCFHRACGLFADLTTPYWLEQGEAELERALGGGPEAAPSRPAPLKGRRLRAPGLVGCSTAMRRVEAVAERAAATDLSVLITGETGTGKELVARTIHGLSSRGQRPFLAVNGGSLRADLALSQLFGHRKGAYTGAHSEGIGLVEAADGGTLFLDEVGELPLDVQATLLRFLESGEYIRLGEPHVRRADVRLIAATNRELRGGGGERLFRRDLLFRLNEIEISVPPLRERADDIVPLARHFLAFYGGTEGSRLTPDAEAVLCSHAWPGNVRELENLMKRLAALHAGEAAVDARILLPLMSRGPAEPAVTTTGTSSDEREAILKAYADAGGNKSRIAELLGVSRKTLYARLRRLHLELP